MAGELVSWPVGLRANFREPLSGPRAVGSGATLSVGNFAQTYGSPFGLWRWRFSFPNLRGQQARRYRGWVTSLHGGANATRVDFCDWDGLSRAEMGVSPGDAEQNWTNGQTWSSGEGWQFTPPVVGVAGDHSLNTTTIRLENQFWGRLLGVGDCIGFYPLHFGMYMVTKVIEPGEYRVWPPLRKALESSDTATLRPTLAMRMESEEAASAARDAFAITGASITLIETLDYDVRDYFAG